ncbi:MAG: triose-phosphate isomerase [Chloroflexia bacterium]|nr:triose-phosphate isomerase [Chloroflexia bacterium]
MSSSTLPYVIGNWKMNLDVEGAMTLAIATAEMADSAVDEVGVGIAAPFPWIPLIASELAESSLLIGSQDVSAHDSGAFTGEVSAGMLAPWCTFAIVGHSERRQHHRESDELIRDKLESTLESGMAAVVCVGETQRQRDAGKALDVVARQITTAAGHLEGARLRNILVAYEPVWAIGTGQTAQPDDAQAIAAHIRSLLAEVDSEASHEIPILYGGSVTADNASHFFEQEDIDGALVGGASLISESFFQIVRAAVESGE